MIKTLLSIIAEASDIITDLQSREATLIQIREDFSDIDELLTKHSITNKNLES